MGKSTKTALILLGLAMLVVWTMPALGDAVSEQRKAKRKLLAIRAARVDAMRKLAERINGLKITSSTTVHDFVTEDDTIDTSMKSWIRGMKEEGKPKFDGEVATVEMSVTLKTVVRKLTQLYTAHYKGDKVKIHDFQKMTELNKITKITEIGEGVVPDELDEEPLISSKKSKGNPRIPPYWNKHCTARGRLMAVRAARIDAMRRLAERIKGVRITSDTTVQDFVTQSDDVNVDMRAFLRGAKEIGMRYHRDELIVEVEMEVVLKTVLTHFKSWVDAHYKGDKVKIKQLEEKIEKVRYDPIREVGMGIPPEKYLKGYGEEQVEVLAVAQKAPPWVSETMRATGESAVDPEAENPAQAKLMAKRAAELDAKRKLGEQLAGLMLTSDTSVKDFVAQSDTIDSRMQTYMMGSKVVRSEVKDDGTAEAVVEIDLKPIWNMYIVYLKKGYE
jgi:hypothetical protein